MASLISIIGLCAVLFLAVSAQQNGGKPSKKAKLVIQPEDAHFPFRGNLTIMCQSDVPLTDCQFKLNHWKLDFPVIELAQGQQSTSFEGMDDEGRLRYKAQYYGTGLKNGQCGVVLTDAFWGRYVVSCRARAAEGGWEQATMTYRAGNPATFPMTLQPQRAVVMPGSDVPVLCSAQQALDVCQVTLPTSEDYIDLNLGAESEASDKHQYYGTGLANGQCGVTMLKVTEEDNGPVWCWGELDGKRGTAKAALITVANAPVAPKLELTTGTTYNEGSSLSAVCTVGGSRPVSTITWLLGSKIIRQDAIDDIPVQEWSWPWDKQTITQRVTLKLTKQDNGKDVTCRATHVALKEPMQTKMKIVVNGQTGAKPAGVRPIASKPVNGGKPAGSSGTTRPN